MNYFLAFLFAGITCLTAQIILDNTNLTPGHITSLYTVFGALLSFLGIYDIFTKYCGAGAALMITNFGHSLYSGAISGYTEDGLLGIFIGMLTKSSAALTSAIVFAFIIGIICKPKS